MRQKQDNVRIGANNYSPLLALALSTLFLAPSPVRADPMILDEGTYTQVGDLKVQSIILRKKTPLTIEPSSTSVAAGASITFAASGGRTVSVFASVGGRPDAGSQTFSFRKNNSGGVIDATTGAYTAGAKENVIDIVIVTDAAGMTAEAQVTVTRKTIALAPETRVLAAPSPQKPLADTLVFPTPADNSAVNWPGNILAPKSAVISMPFSPAASMISSTLTPEIIWPAYPGAVSYKVYISKQPFSSGNTILAEDVAAVAPDLSSANLNSNAITNLSSGTLLGNVSSLSSNISSLSTGTSIILGNSGAAPSSSLQTLASQFSQPLMDGKSYSFLVLPKGVDGKFLVKPSAGFFSSFQVKLAPPTTVVTAGEVALSRFMINDIPASSLGEKIWWNKENAPDGTLTVKGILAPSDATSLEKIASASIRMTASDSWVALAMDPKTGAFAHAIPLKTDAVFMIRFRITTTTGRTVEIAPDPKTIAYHHKTQTEEIRDLLDRLVDAYKANDNRAVLALIDRDYISTAKGFKDYQEFENSLRDFFNQTSTSFCRWNTENIEIIVPQKRLTVSFQWRQTINYSKLNTSRAFTGTARFDIRRFDGQWKIHQDLDRTIFVQDLGPIPAPPD